MKANGFTLVELLAVIVIMGIVFGLVTNNIVNVINKSADKEYDILSQILENAAKIYIEKIQPEELDDVGGTYCVTVQELINDGLVEGPVIDPRDDSEFVGTTCIYVEKTSQNGYFFDFNSMYMDLRLILNGDNPATVTCNAVGNYTDPKADVYDVDNLSEPDISATTSLPLDDAGSYTLHYSYTNGDDVEVTKDREVTITNNYTPSISITGSPTTIHVIKDSSFSAPSATATDTCEGSINVTVISNVIPTVAGNYTVTYIATNKGGVTATKTVSVTVAATLDTAGVNAPTLANNMIPVYWDGSNWKKADNTNLNTSYKWYDYGSTAKMWANAVLVSSTNRATYLAAANGTTITNSDILAFFVWIPRYKYAFPPGNGPRTINVVWESGTSNKAYGSATGTSYLTHPAFTFGTTELTGFWYGKYATGYLGAASSAAAEQNVATSNKITIVPNAYAWSNNALANFFTVSRNMQEASNIYGLDTTGIDTHMAKSVEWAAVSYLSMTIYGVNQEVWLNPTEERITGCAGDKVIPFRVETGCPYAYNTSNGLKSSVTGNIYGVYDMAANTFQYVMGNRDEYVGRNATSTSGFIGYNDDLTYVGTGTSFPASKYVNIYYTSYPDTACNGPCLGHGLMESETADWFDDASTMPSSSPWMMRSGGNVARNEDAGTFSYKSDQGDPYAYGSFRMVLTAS